MFVCVNIHIFVKFNHSIVHFPFYRKSLINREYMWLFHISLFLHRYSHCIAEYINILINEYNARLIYNKWTMYLYLRVFLQLSWHYKLSTYYKVTCKLIFI